MGCLYGSVSDKSGAVHWEKAQMLLLQTGQRKLQLMPMPVEGSGGLERCLGLALVNQRNQ